MILDNETFTNIIPLIGLYAETHFRFGGWTPSLLFKKEPEIVFDMPKRIDPNNSVPVFLQINDFKKYPFIFQNLVIVLSQNGKSRIILNTYNINDFELKHNFSENAPTYVFWIPSKEFSIGNFSLTCKLEIKFKKKTKVIINNNLRTSDKKSLTGYYSNKKLPGYKKCIYGDLHVHSQYTESHVEFCPPIKAIDIAAYTFGLDFLSITDHSYDISCDKSNYLVPDPNIERWNLFQKEISNIEFKTNVLAGEEISVLNSENRIVHLGGVGLKRFIPGSADGARKKVSKITNSPTIENAAKSIHSDEGIVFAAHPGAKSGFMQRIFLKRGIWQEQDLTNSVDAFQAVNNGFRVGWYRARKLWINKLLKGHKLPLIAGNDSHGDFNRYISLKIPFIYITDIDKRYLGFGRTGIYSNRNLMKNEIISSVKNGKTFVSTGPFIEIVNNNNLSLISHNEVNISEVIINALSTEEFGNIDIIRIFGGNVKESREDLFILRNNLNTPEVSLKIDIPSNKNYNYIRAEVICCQIGISDVAMAATSPVYFQ